MFHIYFFLIHYLLANELRTKRIKGSFASNTFSPPPKLNRGLDLEDIPEENLDNPGLKTARNKKNNSSLRHHEKPTQTNKPKDIQKQIVYTKNLLDKV